MIQPDAGGGNAEHVRGAPIEVGVELDLEVLGLVPVIAATEWRLNRRVRAAPHARAHVERIVIEHEPDFHAAAGRAALDGFFLNERGDRRGGLPGLLVETAVDVNSVSGHAHRARLRAARDDILRGNGQGNGEQRETQEKCAHGVASQQEWPFKMNGRG